MHRFFSGKTGAVSRFDNLCTFDEFHQFSNYYSTLEYLISTEQSYWEEISNKNEIRLWAEFGVPFGGVMGNRFF